MDLCPARPAIVGTRRSSTVLDAVDQVQPAHSFRQVFVGQTRGFADELPHRLIDQQESIDANLQILQLVPGQAMALFAGRCLELYPASHATDPTLLVDVEEVHGSGIGPFLDDLDRPTLTDRVRAVREWAP